jgi:hypothetical protein
MSHCGTAEKTGKNAGFANVAANLAAVETKPEALDADLAAVVKAWPMLPAAVKAGILAMVKAAGGEQ